MNYYKNDQCIGIKLRGGGQVFTFGSGKGLDETRLRAWADDVLKHLDSGMPEKKAKKWIDERLSL